MLQLIPPIQHHIHTNPNEPPPNPTPGWQHRLWDTTTIPALIDNDPPICDLYLHYLTENNHTAIRNLLRIAVLHKSGGVYTEPDIHLAEGLRTAPYMDDDAWLLLAPTQPQDPDEPPNISGRIMATRPGHPYLNSLRRAISRIAETRIPTADDMGDALLTEAFARKKRKDIPLVELATVTAPPPTPTFLTNTPHHEQQAPTPPPPSPPKNATPENEPAPPLEPPRWNLNPPAPRGPSYTRTPPESPRW